MGGLLHLFDFHSNNIARKVFAQKSRDEDLEAPRNSFELQVENFRDKKDMPHSYGFGEEWFERSCYPIEASMKKHINDELSKRSSDKQNGPSIVAKLMGVDALPLEAKSMPWLNYMKEDYHEIKMSEKGGRNRKGWSSIGRRARGFDSLEKMETESLYCERSDKPKRREHPQEEELQKFKREFEAWQAARFRECSKIVDVGNDEKLPLIHTDRRGADVLKNGNKHRESGLLDAHRCESELVVPEQKQKLFTRTRSFGREFNLKSDRAPTSIVVLKPGPHWFYDYEDSMTTSSGTMEDSRGSIEDFLEEVKERLKCELQGRALKRSSTVRGSGIETPFSERPVYDDNNCAKNAVRAGAGDNFGRNKHLPRSESTRSYRSEVQCNAPDSPEFISRDTRRLLAERLRNVLRREVNPADTVRLAVSDAERRLKQTGEILEDDDQEDMRAQSLRRGDGYDKDEDVQVGTKGLSPRNLVRSLSAPVSGTSFGKLLLEDRHVLTGTQIKRKHEAAEQVPSVDPTRRKERFNFRKKVSSFRSTLRGRIFGKKIRSMIESNSFEDEYIKDFVTGSRFSNFYDTNENSTEVPPSPASVCSSTPEEFWRNVDYLSPISTPDVTIADENGVPQVFRDISANLSELRRQINELESDLREDTPSKQEANEPETVDLTNPDKAFLRDLLVASGLYDGTSDKPLSRYDPFAKPISESVFKETEENHRKRTKQSSENNANNKSAETETETDHNILFDLLNEALAVVLGPPLTQPGFGRKLTNSSGLTHANGKRLLESAWQIISEYLYAQTDKQWCSLDGIIAWDLGSRPWNSLLVEESNVLGREVEGLIMADLIEDVVKYLQLKRLHTD